ncbi:hypothetical protein [Microbulbifer thermotolerans]|uniref:hypothetical protein n=1 Tax=Microbulbifer thermotolerans TaxID=252514 RepID=UPI003F591401
MELAGGVVGKFQLFAVGQCGGDAVAGGVVVVGDFCLALPVGDEAKEGFLFLWVSRNDPEMLVSMPLPVSVTVRF